MIVGIATAFAVSAAAQSIQDADLRAGRVRTELPPGVGVANHPLNLTYTQPEPQGCLWNAQDAFSGCPGRAGLPNLPNGAPVWAGTLEGREACGGLGDVERLCRVAKLFFELLALGDVGDGADEMRGVAFGIFQYLAAVRQPAHRPV